MGTEITELEDKQKELKDWIEKIGFTRNKFAQYFYNDTESENEEETKQFQEKFKKQLQRKTTKIETIDKYLKFLYELPEFDKLNYIKPNYIVDNDISDIFNRRMKKISENITNKIKDED